MGHRDPRVTGVQAVQIGHRDPRVTRIQTVQMGHRDPGVTGVQIGYRDPRVTKMTGAIRGPDPVRIQCSTQSQQMKSSPHKQILMWIA